MPWLLLTLCSLWLSLSLLWPLQFLSTSQDDIILYFDKSFRSVQTRPSSNGFWSAPQVQWATEFSAALRPRLHPLHVHHSNLSLTSSCRCSCSPGGFFLPSKDIPSCSYFFATAQPQEWTFLLLSTLAMVSSLHFKERHFLQKKNCLLSGQDQEQACSRITQLVVCRHHAENGPIHRKMVDDCPLVITSKVTPFPDQARPGQRNEWSSQSYAFFNELFRRVPY